ncbi:MAG: PAS domain S-box protein [Deltaproteobacteria bacterium]
MRKGVEKELREAHEQLEKRVKERTEELEKTNVKLKIEIAERKQAEEALRLEQAQLLSIFDSINEIIYVADPGNHEVIYANKVMRDLFGTDSVGGKCYQVLQERTAPCDFCTNDIILKEKGKPYRWEYHNPRLDRDFMLTDRIIKWPDGRDLRFELGIDITDRKRAETALRESEEFNRKLVQHAPMGIVQLSADGIVEYANPASNRIFNIPDGEASPILGLNIFELPLLGEQAHVRDQFRRLMRGEYVSDVEISYRSPEGKELTLIASGTPKVAPDGSIAGAVIMYVDITERKKAEEALRASEEKYRVVVEKALEGILIAQNGIIKFANPRVSELFGYQADELVPKAFTDFIHPADRKKVLERHQRRLQGEKFPSRYPIRIAHANGTTRWVEIDSVLIPWDGKPATLVFLTDITDRKQAEEERLLLVTAIEQASEAVIVTYASGIIEYVNPAFERTTRYSREEAVGQKPSLLKSGQHNKEFYGRLWDTIRAGGVWTGRFANKRKDGTLYQEDAAISPVRDSSGAIVNFVALKRDVTQEVELEKQLLQAQKMEAVGTLAGGVAHDFNNLLQIVLGFAELLLMGKCPEDPGYRHLRAIQEAAARGSELVQRILTFSRKIEIHPRPIDLNHEVSRAKELLSRTVPKMISIDLRLADDLKTVHADPGQIELILLNIAINAKDAMPDGGRLVIETRNVNLDWEGDQRHMQLKPGEYVMLKVADNGHGMEKEVLDRIFEPFYTTKKAGEGTGLGLAMVFGIVKSHNGHIVARSEPGKGTTFNIYLPALEAEANWDVETSREMPAFGIETILLVDDEELIRDLGKQILTQGGYTVLTAENGFKALEIYRERQDEIALVVLDLVMPEMGGKQCLSELLRINPNAEVLVATGHSLDGAMRDDLGALAKGFVKKPYGAKDILGKVRGVLDED